jgi:ribosomal protein L44E
MPMSQEVCYCPSCQALTQHVVVLVRKPSPYESSPNRTQKEFFSGFVKSIFLGAFIASMDEFSRHVICEKCGNKTVEE